MAEQIRILLIDDEPGSLDAASRLLSGAGYHVLAAATGADGLALACAEDPDLILLDAGLPDVPGAEVCRRLKARPDLARSLVILISDPESPAPDAGADGYLTRPIAGAQLLAWVKTLARPRDIEHERADLPTWQALQKSEAQMRAIFRAAPVGIGVVSERVFLDVNDRLCEITGYSRAELIGKSARMVYPSDEEYEFVGTEKYRQIREQGTGAVETRFQRKDGTIVDVLLSSTPLDLDDLAAGVTFTALDITGRKRVEEALRDSEAKFRSVVQSSPMGMHMYQMQDDGRLVFIGANPAADRILGVDHDEFMGQIIEDAFPSLVGTEVPERYRRIAALGEPWVGEQIDYADERIAGAFEVYAFQTEPDKMVAMFLDITGRKRAEEALRHERDMAQRYLDIAAVMFVALNARGEVVLLNRKGCEILGYEPEEVLGQSWFDRFLPAAAAPEARWVFERLIAGEVELVEYHENAIVTRDGEERIIAWHNTMLKDDQGRVTGTLSSGEDITARKRAEEALRKSEEKYRSLYEVMAQGAFYRRADGVLIDVNQAALEMFGLSRDEFLGRTSRSPQWHVVGEDGSVLAADEHPSIVALRTGRPAHDVTIRVYNPRREDYVWVTINAIPQFRPGEDEPYQVFVTMHDITERERVEEALRESERKFRTLVDQAPEAVFLYDMDGRIVDVNQTTVDRYGYSREDLLGMGISDVDPDYVEPEEGPVLWRVSRGGKHLRFESRHRRKDGTVFPVEISLSAIELGGVGHVLALADDITERQAAQEALKRRAAQLLLLNDIGGQIAAVLDLDSLLSRAASLVQRSFGYHHVALFTRDHQQEGMLMRARAGDFDDLFPLDHRLEMGQGLVGWVALHGETVLANDVDGEPRYVNRYPNLLPTRSELTVPVRVGGEVVGVLDVQSPRRDAFDDNDVLVLETLSSQIAVAIRNARLFAEIEAALQQLRETQAQLVQSAKLAAIGELAAGVAHEINNPLTSILGFAELATWQLGPEDPGRQEFDIIIEEARRSRTIVRGLLEFARQTRPMTEPADLNDVLRQTLALVRAHVEKDGIVVEEEYATDLGMIPLDAGQMKQVFLNLITNAAHAMPQGGTLTIGTLREGDRLLVRIGDTGTGIAPEDRERIFEPFFTTRPSGTGLGLSVSLGIVQQHGGQIEVESRTGEGSTFTVWLPAGENG